MPNPLTPEHWIEAATQLLVDGGAEHVRVDVIARQLGVTRGSFYWHFKDRDELLQRMLQAWRELATVQVNQRFSDASADPRELIHKLLSLPFRGRAALRAARVELAIRDWARRDPMARHAVDEADAMRVSYIAQCFSALGFSIPDARQRAQLLYAYELGESLMAHQGSAELKAQRSALMERLLLSEPTVD
ncbi:TetR/AcrR family transcriptional regulator [Pelomonas sp. KK5]|uniref:TetR/AcrR family transcriptional regulator n=1 Tax=Pelomonas sp. KK5 TaxID=1855730 RepID=UPI00097BDBAF|nr:TetR/AcrR family transcriptional regulator [Pelomonas sp. KK5]